MNDREQFEAWLDDTSGFDEHDRLIAWAAWQAAIKQFAESECDKVMAMTDEQVRALSAVQGSSADIDALTTKVALTRAMMRFQTTRAVRAEAELARQNAANDMIAKERDAWERRAKSAEQDAARYRWLRVENSASRDRSPYETDYWVSILFRRVPPSLNGYVTVAYRGEELDSAIDAELTAAARAAGLDRV